MRKAITPVLTFVLQFALTCAVVLNGSAQNAAQTARALPAEGIVGCHGTSVPGDPARPAGGGARSGTPPSLDWRRPRASAREPPLRKARPVARYVVDVMPKREILDPQGKAVLGALHRAVRLLLDQTWIGTSYNASRSVA